MSTRTSRAQRWASNGSIDPDLDHFNIHRPAEKMFSLIHLSSTPFISPSIQSIHNIVSTVPPDLRRTLGITSLPLDARRHQAKHVSRARQIRRDGRQPAPRQPLFASASHHGKCRRYTPYNPNDGLITSLYRRHSILIVIVPNIVNHGLAAIILCIAGEKHR